MIRSLAIALAGCLGLGACGWLNPPDRDLLRSDGGVDGGSDAGPLDAGVDAQVLIDGCVFQGPEDCANQVDDNCDGLVDCADFSCSDQTECCQAGGAATQQWDRITGWNAVPDAMFPSNPPGNPAHISAFGSGDIPRALVPPRCTPLAVGMDLRFTLTSTPGGACTAPDREDCFAALVLGPTRNMAMGQRLLDDLSITVRDGGRLEVAQGGDVIATAEGIVASGATLEVTVSIGPGTDELGQAALFATVRARDLAQPPDAGQEVLARRAFLAQSDLLGSVEGCTDTPGLYVAVEGRGGRVEVGPLNTQEYSCVNPSQFQAPEPAMSSHLETTALGLTEWAQGGLAAPALAGSLESAGGSTRWDLLFDATDADRELERVSDIGFAWGHAVAPPGTWSSGWIGGDTPRLGDCHASCVGSPAPSCGSTACPDAVVAVREPSLVALTDADGELRSLVAAYAVEQDDGTYALTLAPLPSNRPSSFSPPAEPSLVPDGEICVSLRDPSLVRAGGDLLDGYWVFYTCEPAAGPTSIWARHVDEFLEPTEGEPSEIIASDIGPYAQGGVRAPEALVEFDPRATSRARGVFRVWFTARDASGSAVTIGLMQGQTTAEQAAANDLPVFLPYPANPVLRIDHPVLGVGCGAGCDLLGVGVARPGSLGSSEVRFVVARRVNTPGLAEYALVPLNQFWRNPWLTP